MNNKVLITGAIGFIGFHLTEKLLSEGYEVIGIDNINSYYPGNYQESRQGQKSKIQLYHSSDRAGQTRRA